METQADPPDPAGSDPKIRIKVNLDDLGLWDTQFPKDAAEKLDDSASITKALPKAAALAARSYPTRLMESDSADLMNRITSRMGTRGRPRLVTTEDFRSSLLKVAQSIIVTRKSEHAVLAEIKDPDMRSIGSCSPTRRSRPPLEVSPLIKAFQRVMHTNDQIVTDTAEVPPMPTFTQSLQERGDSVVPAELKESVSPPLPEDQTVDVIHLHDAPTQRKELLGIHTYIDMYSNANLPEAPVPVVDRQHWSTQVFREGSSVPGPRDLPAPIPHDVPLSSREQMRLFRILENISCRRIWRAWKRYKTRRKPHEDVFKQQLRSLVMAALDNSKRIREELSDIREHLAHPVVTSPPAVTPRMTRNEETQVSRSSSSTALGLNSGEVSGSHENPAIHHGHPLFKSARILIAPSVQSPVMMDKLLDDITLGIGRNAVRMCSAQQTLHPKAFVVVVSSTSLAVEEWKSRLMNCYYIYAWDQAFPLFHTAADGTPWEVKVRCNMDFIAPVWALTGAHAIYNSSGEFVAPETSSTDSEKISMCLRAVWPQGGLYLWSPKIITVIGTRSNLDGIIQSRSMQYLARDLDFTHRRKSTAHLKSLGLDDFDCFDIEFQTPLTYGGRDILVLPPKLCLPLSSDLHRVRGESVEDMFMPLSDQNKNGPYTMCSGSGLVHVLCPKCRDSFPLSDQENLVDDYQPPNHHHATLCNISQLHEQAFLGSESIQSLDSFSEARSERTFGRKSDAMHSCLEDVQEEPVIENQPIEIIPPPTPYRRASCPTLSMSAVHVVPVKRRALSMQSTEVFFNGLTDDSHISRVESRKERIRMSISKLSANVVALSRNKGDKSSVHSEELSGIIPEEHPSDLLSPISTRKKDQGTFRMVADPQNREGSCQGNSCGSSAQPASFVPSEIGKELMGIFTNSKDQRVLWDVFCNKARLPVIEYADAQAKMPSVVFTLRGLLRFGDGEYGSTRTDAIALLLQILAGKHIVCDTSSFIEAAEHSASLLSLLSVHPVSRHSGKFTDLKPRVTFQAVLASQSCLILQQVVSVLSQQLPKWLATESIRTTCIPITCRTVSGLLEVLFMYCSVPALRSAWTTSSPSQFQQSIPRVIASIGQRIPALLPKSIDLLDAVLDHIPRMDAATITHTASMLRTGTIGNPELAVKLKQWEKRRHGFGSFFGLAKSISSKSRVFDEFNKHTR